MKQFNQEERTLMMLYSPGTRVGLVEELQRIRRMLTPKERWLRRLTDRTLEKLAEITDAEFDELDLYSELDALLGQAEPETDISFRK